jgi:hypothetical protein
MNELGMKRRDATREEVQQLRDSYIDDGTSRAMLARLVCDTLSDKLRAPQAMQVLAQLRASDGFDWLIDHAASMADDMAGHADIAESLRLLTKLLKGSAK